MRAIKEPRIAEKYHEVAAFLVEGGRGAKLEVITAGPDLELVDFDIKTIKDSLDRDPRIGKVDVSRVPADELDYVYYAVRSVEATKLLGTSGGAASYKNAVWPLTIPMRRGGKVVKVRYELIFDENANVRAERLGEVRADELPAAFRKLDVAGKKASLVKEFGLSGLDDRPAFTPPPPPAGAPAGAPAAGQQGAPAGQAPGAPAGGVAAGGAPPPPPRPRPERKWKSEELDQLKGALDRLPLGERPILQGVALVRDFEPPPEIAGAAGVFQAGEDKDLDEPGPPAHPPPHIHYYDRAFTSGKFGATGAPGAAGSGVEHTFLHEIGHLRIGRELIGGNAALDAAAAKETAARAAITEAVKGTTLSTPKLNAWKAWQAASATASTAITDYSTAVNEFATKSQAAQKSNDPFPDPAALEPKLAAAQAAIAATAEALKLLDKRGLPAKLRTPAAKLGEAFADHLKARQQRVAYDRQVPIFAKLATRFGFHPFTDYARKGGEGEWFAETYSLWVTDPDRLNTMSPKLFQWFQAGMPQDENWQPPTKP